MAVTSAFQRGVVFSALLWSVLLCSCAWNGDGTQGRICACAGSAVVSCGCRFSNGVAASLAEKGSGMGVSLSVRKVKDGIAEVCRRLGGCEGDACSVKRNEAT